MGLGPISGIEFRKSGQPDRLSRLIGRRQHERGRQLMTYSIAAPAGPVGRRLVGHRLVGHRLAAIAGTAILTVAFAVATSTLASAQTPAPAPAAPAPAAPKPAPAKKPAAPKPPAAQAAPPPAEAQQPPPPQGQAQGGGDNVQLIFSPWTKFCLKGQDANAKQACFTGKDARIESGMLVVAAVLIEPEGEPKKVLRLTLPLGMQLVPGTRVIIDQNQPMTAPYVICVPNGCMADYEVTADMITKMKSGQALVVQAFNSTGQPLSLVMPLADFAKAHDGPPTDPKEFEAQQRKLQEELQRRADEARKKLEQQQAQPQAQAPKQ
jgi:invasion protein IalB